MTGNTIYNSGQDYDQQYADYDRDIEFLLGLASEYADDYPPIAEFACGTGRVTIPLSRAGFDVFGIDITPAMLDRLGDKLSGQKVGDKGYVKTMVGDMRNSSTIDYGNHHLVLVPFTAFLHMTSQKDQIAALKNFWGHLVEGGHLMIDIFNPRLDRLTVGPGEPQSPKVEKQIPINNGTQILVRSVVSEYQRATQHCRWVFFVDIYDSQSGEKIRSYREEATIQVIFPNEWRLLLHLAGFTIEQEWGDFQRQPFANSSPRMLFLARKSHKPLI